MISAVKQLPSTVRFNMVGYNDECFVWTSTTAKATTPVKEKAILWLESLVPQRGMCISEAGVAACDMSKRLPRGSKMLFVGLLHPSCGVDEDYDDDALELITSANQSRVPIDVAHVSIGDSPFWQSLAYSNKGVYYRCRP